MRQRLGMVYGGLDEGMNVYEWWKNGWKAAAKTCFCVSEGRLYEIVIRVNERCGLGIYLEARMPRVYYIVWERILDPKSLRKRKPKVRNQREREGNLRP